MLTVSILPTHGEVLEVNPSPDGTPVIFVGDKPGLQYVTIHTPTLADIEALENACKVMRKHFEEKARAEAIEEEIEREIAGARVLTPHTPPFGMPDKGSRDYEEYSARFPVQDTARD